jgi:hypothetical protein
MSHAVTIESLRQNWKAIDGCIALIPKDLTMQCIDPAGRERPAKNHVSIRCGTPEVSDRLQEFKASLQERGLEVTLKVAGSS